MTFGDIDSLFDAYKQTALNTDSVGGGAATAVASADKKSVTITLTAGQITDLGAAGLGTLDDVAYRLFVTQAHATDKVADLSGNKVATNSYVNFQGVIAADNTPPVLQTATLDLEAGTFALNFNEVVTIADVTKVSVTNGTATRAFTTSDTPAGTTTIVIEERQATRTNLISIQGNQYSVPSSFARRKVCFRRYKKHLELLDGWQVVDTIPLTYGRGKCIIRDDHYPEHQRLRERKTPSHPLQARFAALAPEAPAYLQGLRLPLTAGVRADGAEPGRRWFYRSSFWPGF